MMRGQDTAASDYDRKKRCTRAYIHCIRTFRAGSGPDHAALAKQLQLKCEKTPGSTNVGPRVSGAFRVPITHNRDKHYVRMYAALPAVTAVLVRPRPSAPAPVSRTAELFLPLSEHRIDAYHLLL